MKNALGSLVILTAVVLLAGCNKPAEQAPPPQPPKPEGITPVRQTSFDEVTQQLDPGGTVYAYLSTDQWLGEASTKLIEWRGVLQGMPNVSTEDRQRLEQVFGVLTDLVRKSGVEDLTGVGMSGIQVTPDLFRTKMILHHKAGAGDGFLWSMMGREPHAMEGLNLLSTNTALAGFGDFDVKVLWQVIQQEAAASGIPELAGPVENWPALFERQTQLSWDKVLASLGGEVGIVLTMDDQRKITLPVPGQVLELSEPALMLVAKVNDDLIFDRIKSQLESSQMAQITEENGLKQIVLPMPLPLPIELKITIASGGGYLFIASNPKVVAEAMAIRAGTTPGLRQNADFAAMMKYLPSQGNQFFYIDRRFSETVQNLQRQSLKAQSTDPGQRRLIEKLLLSQPPSYGLSVGAHTGTGWQTVSVGNQDASVALAAVPAAAVTAVGAALVLPSMAKAKSRAQSINCMNNMKQVSLALRIWANDYSDKYPFQMSQADGGTKELCEIGADGYDANSYLHLKALAQYLGTPKILVCPADSSKTVASSFADLAANNVSYQLRTASGIDLANPQEVILYCPVHHHQAFVDGSVHQGKP